MRPKSDTFWYDSKAWVAENLAIEGLFGHVLVGTVLFVLAAVLFRNFRWPLISACGLVFALQVFNEAMDARDWVMWTGSINWTETALDTMATLIVPVLLCVLVYWNKLVTRTNLTRTNSTRTNPNRRRQIK